LANNQDSEETPIEGKPDLRVFKDDGKNDLSRADRARPGDLITYRIHYDNIGLRDATESWIRERVPDYTVFVASASSPGWSCPDASPAGTECTIQLGQIYPEVKGNFTFSVRVIANLPPTVKITHNCVEIGNTCDDCNPFNNIACDATPLFGVPDLTINSTARCVSLHWFLEWSNKGDQSANNVVVTETIPVDNTFDALKSDSNWQCAAITAGATCTLDVGTLPAGAGGSAVFVTTPLETSQLTEFTDTVSIDGTGRVPDPTPEDNTDSATVSFEGCPDACDACCPEVEECCPDNTEVIFNFGGILEGLEKCQEEEGSR